MSNEEQPLSAWQQCKAIQESLSPKPLSAEEAERKVRSVLLTQLAATGEHGAAMAARLANASGPIPMDAGDMEALEAMKQRIAEKTGIKDIDGHTAISISLLE
jgi:hypothetical protein